jgi:hypothetical protein
MVYSGDWGKLIHEKNQKSKISWHCPFKQPYPSRCKLSCNAFPWNGRVIMFFIFINLLSSSFLLKLFFQFFKLRDVHHFRLITGVNFIFFVRCNIYGAPLYSKLTCVVKNTLHFPSICHLLLLALFCQRWHWRKGQQKLIPCVVDISDNLIAHVLTLTIKCSQCCWQLVLPTLIIMLTCVADIGD